MAPAARLPLPALAMLYLFTIFVALSSLQLGMTTPIHPGHLPWMNVENSKAMNRLVRISKWAHVHCCVE